MNSLEDYQNLVELLRRALLFYANDDNYINIAKYMPGFETYVDTDHGSQARFALSKIEEINDLYDKMLEEYTEDNENILLKEALNNIVKFE